MSCSALINILIAALITICLPIAIYTMLVQNKFNRLMKAHKIEKAKLKDEAGLPAEVRKQLKELKKWAYTLLGVMLVWIFAMGLAIKFCS